MKKTQIVYWITTGIIALMMLFSAFNYFTNADMKLAFEHLGFPDYFRIGLGIAKVLGAIALILPQVPLKVKGFAYAGFAIVFVSAFGAHLSVGDPISVAIAPVVFAVLLAISYFYFEKRKQHILLQKA